jgi:hypothetical protein
MSVRETGSERAVGREGESERERERESEWEREGDLKMPKKGKQKGGKGMSLGEICSIFVPGGDLSTFLCREPIPTLRHLNPLCGKL